MGFANGVLFYALTFVRGVHILQEMGPDALRETVLQYFALGGSRVQVWL